MYTAKKRNILGSNAKIAWDSYILINIITFTYE